MENQQGITIVRCDEHSGLDPLSTLLYFHNRDLIQNPNPKETIKKSKLINLWNRLHFMEDTVYVHLRHPDYKEDLLIQTHPVPCSKDTMTCRWPEGSDHFTENASILNIILSDGLTLLLVPATQIEDVQKDYFTIRVPDKGYILGQRQGKRYRCQGINTEVMQNGFQLRGQLTNFSSLAFTVKVSPVASSSFHWFNAENLSTVNLYQEGQMVFSAACRCIRQTSDPEAREILLAPTNNQISRFLKKKMRNPRIRIAPLPNISFDHPLIKKYIQLDVCNLSTSGFAILVSAEEDVLLVGMIIPDLTMNYAGALKIQCKVQVLYRREEKKGHIRYGFVFLDMDVGTYNRLSYIVMNVIDSGTHIADEVDGDRLWEFLFESGFIYPKKYDMVQANRKPIKETYRRLYQNNPEIIVQMTYQRNGQLYAHVSMVRSYKRTWMVHHLAARPLNNKRTGLRILKQVIRYFDGFYRLPTVEMDYVMFYFRPDNRFPDHFLGGFARHFNNPRACSLDLFVYLNYPASDIGQSLPAGWSLGPCTDKDLEELSHFYRNTSNGLLLNVLRLGEVKEDGEYLTQLYARNGLIRSCQSLALKKNGSLMAVLVVNRSDPGLSLSDFLNGIKVLVTDVAGLPWEVLSAVISQLSGSYKLDKIPLLIYPSNYLEIKGVPFEKRYNLWILDVHYGREFSEYMMNNTKLRLKFIIRLLIKKYVKT